MAAMVSVSSSQQHTAQYNRRNYLPAGQEMAEKEKLSPEELEYRNSVEYHRKVIADYRFYLENKTNPALVTTSEEQKNLCGTVLAVLVISLMLSLIATVAVLVSPGEEPRELRDPFSLDDMFCDDFKPKVFEAQWVKDKDAYIYRSEEGSLVEYDATTDQAEVIMDNSTFRLLNTDTYFVSEDRQNVLLAYDIQQVNRHSFLAKYKIYRRNVTVGQGRLVVFPNGQQWEGKVLQFAGWGSQGASLAFVHGNNMYYQPSPVAMPTQVTKSGESKHIVNGIPDWLYEEEILMSNKAHWWSPGARYICYASFDDSRVPVYNYPTYGSSVYGNIEGIPYPKAGDNGGNVNPTVQLLIMDTQNLNASHKELRPPSELEGQEYYVTGVSWKDKNHVVVSWSNRAQNMSVITICDVITTDCNMNMIRTNGGRGWVNVPEPLFIDGGTKYLMILPERDGSSGFWKHIAIVTMPAEKEGRKSFVTHGEWDVTEIMAFDERTRYVYYQSTNGDPRKRHIFRVEAVESSEQLLNTPECLTCDFSEDCQYISAKFSASTQYYVLHCEGPGVPTYTLYSLDQSVNITIEDNSALASRLSEKAISKKEYLEIPVEGGEKIWAQINLPPSLKKDHIAKFPLLVHTYGGPDTQEVTERFSLGWGEYLSSSERVIYASIDARGTAARGDRFLHTIYRKLGTLEVLDQITAAKYMQENMDYVDADRTAIWGWSYGGFVSAHALGDPYNTGVFTCGISVAPVTDWRYYDTAFSEKYMGFANKQDNFMGYENANVSNKAHNFAGKHFMLVHGTGDDNVHFQNSAQLAKALTEADVDFRMQIYSDKKHAIDGQPIRRHLYRTMTNFLKHDCWEGGLPKIKGEYVAEYL